MAKSITEMAENVRTNFALFRDVLDGDTLFLVDNTMRQFARLALEYAFDQVESTENKQFMELSKTKIINDLKL